jgi:hypothetical protein
MSINASLEAETNFFSSHSIWQKVDQSLVGVDTLKEKLVLRLEAIVTNGLSDVLTEIDKQLLQNASHLDSLGQSMESASERRSVFACAVDEYTRLLQDAVSGKYESKEFFEVVESNQSKEPAIAKGM